LHDLFPQYYTEVSNKVVAIDKKCWWIIDRELSGSWVYFWRQSSEDPKLPRLWNFFLEIGLRFRYYVWSACVHCFITFETFFKVILRRVASILQSQIDTELLWTTCGRKCYFGYFETFLNAIFWTMLYLFATTWTSQAVAFSISPMNE